MMRSPLPCFLVAFFALLVGRVAAQANLTIAVTGLPSNVTASGFLQPTDVVLNDCTDECNAAQTAIAACTDNACLCQVDSPPTVVNATVSLVTKCEQCMFNALITRRKPADDPRAGQSAALSAYVAACNTANITVITNGTASTLTIAAADAALTLPPNWDGPFGQGLNIGTTVVTVAAATLLGGGLIGVLITM